MSLFKKKTNDKIYQIPYSNSFRGFKHFIVNVYKNAEAEKNNLLFINIDLSDSIFVFFCFDTEYAVKSGRMQQEGSVESVVIRLLTLRENS